MYNYVIYLGSSLSLRFHYTTGPIKHAFKFWTHAKTSHTKNVQRILLSLVPIATDAKDQQDHTNK